MRKLRHYLGIQLATLSLLALAPLLFLFLVELPERHQQALDEQAAQVGQALAVVRNDAAAVFDVARGTLRMLTMYPAVRNGEWDECRRIVTAVTETFPRYAFIGVVAADGTLTCPSRPTPPGTHARDRLWFQRVQAAQGFVVGEYAIGRSSGRPSLHLAAPVVRDGAFVGAANVALDAGWLADRLAAIPTAPHATTYVMDEKGTVLATQPVNAARVGSRVDETRLVARLLEQDRGRGRFDLAGDSGIVDFITVPEASQAGRIVIAIATDGAAVVAQAERQFWRAITILALVALGCVALLMAGLHLQVIRPVGSIAQSVTRFREEGHIVPARRPLLRNEISMLADTLAEAAAAITQREAQKAALARGELLLREVAHRVKNHLAALASMVQIEAMRLGDTAAEAPMQSVQPRIAALGELYSMLADGSDSDTVSLAAYLERIVDSLRSFGTRHGERVSIRAEIRGDVTLGVDKAVAIGILTNEIITNAIKHAFAGGAGEIRVRLDATDPRVVDLAIGDDGSGGQGNAGRGASLGLTIISAMVRQLDAVLDISHDGGTTYALRIPLTSVPEQAQTPA